MKDIDLRLASLMEEPELWEQGILCLGSLGRRLRHDARLEEFKRVSRLISLQFTQYQKTRTNEVLAAVSNLGDEALLPRVKPYLSSEDVRVRRSALVALRHMKTAEVDPLLAEALRREKKKNILLATLSAVRLRGNQPRYKEELTRLLARKELDGQVRRRATALLEGWATSPNSATGWQ